MCALFLHLIYTGAIVHMSKRNLGDLYDMDAQGWAWFDNVIGRAADDSMVGVDAETVRLFRQYKVRMPADFGRECPHWDKPKAEEYTLPGKPVSVSDETLYRSMYKSSTLEERREIAEAIRNTDARRIGQTPPEYIKWEALHASQCAVHKAKWNTCTCALYCNIT